MQLTWSGPPAALSSAASSVPISARHSADKALVSVRSVDTPTGSTEVLWIVRVKVNTPPGSGSVLGEADLVIETVGSTFVTVTVSVSSSEASLFSSSVTVTSAVFSKLPVLVWLTV